MVIDAQTQHWVHRVPCSGGMLGGVILNMHIAYSVLQIAALELKRHTRCTHADVGVRAAPWVAVQQAAMWDGKCTRRPQPAQWLLVALPLQPAAPPYSDLCAVPH